MTTTTYHLHIAERLDPGWAVWLGNAALVDHPDGGTLIAATLPDQTALHALLARVRDLSLTLVGLQQLRAASAPDAAPPHQSHAAQERAILDAVSDGLVIRDLDGQIIAANLAFCRMHGYTHTEVLAMGVHAFTQPEDYGRFRAYLDAIRAGERAQMRSLNLRKDGSTFPVEVLGMPFSYDGRPHILSTVRDVSEQAAAVEQLERGVAERTRELRALLEVARTVASTLDLAQLFTLILDQLHALVAYRGAAIYLCENDGETLVSQERRGPATTTVRFAINQVRPIWEAIRHGAPLIIPDVLADTPMAQAYQVAAGAELLTTYSGVRAWMALPLLQREQLYGYLCLSRAQPESFSDHDADLAGALAAQASVAISNARLLAASHDAAAQAERQRLARDLHDAVTQQLFSASLIGEALPQIWAANPAQGAAYLEDLRLLTRGALAEMRALLVELRPAALTDTPLPDLLQHLATALSGRARLPVALRVDGAAPLPPEVQVALYRVAQEALQNAAKHARAAHVWVQLTLAAGVAHLEVRDDGRGFDPAAVPADHFGLGIMRERMAAIGGEVTLESAPGAGTALTARWADLARHA